MLRACLLHLALIALSLPFAHMCGAQDNEPAVQATLRVGVRVAQPFVIAQEGGYGGLAIDLWEQIASEQGWAFEYREVGLNTLFDQVSAGELDIGLGALTVTAEREQRVDFSHPFHSGGLGIAVAAGEPAGIAAILQRLLSWRFLAWIGGLTVLLAAVGAAAWALERRANPEQFGGTPLQGMGSGSGGPR